jgi:photosystem II stability/assembly factor-like uncharacterized protein
VDGGQTWEEIASQGCGDITISKGNPQHIFVAGEIDYEYLALHKSLDGGVNWTSKKISSQTGGEALAIALHPSNENTIYVGGTFNWLQAALFKSTNGGTSWQNKTGSLRGTVYSIAVSPNNPSRIFVGTDFGIWRSDNSASSWVKKSDRAINSILFNPLNPKTVYAGGSYGVFRSTDGGNTWQEYNTGLIVKNVMCLAFNKARKILFAGTEGGSIWKRGV